ncbi:MAG: helix-turn-helix domain-containing protein [Candidatus Izemoplasmatales bacterium]
MDEREQIEAVARMQTYIEDHLDEPIALCDLARAAAYSPWHAARMFREYTGRAPFDYIRSYRLSKAAVALRDGERRVVDVAFDFMFGSHEGFTKAFSRQFGIAPKRYAETTPAIRLFLPWDVRPYHLEIKNGGTKMKKKQKHSILFVQVVERPKRKVLVRRGVAASGYFEYCEEVGCDVWGVLSSVKEALYEPIGMWLPDKLIRPGTSKYVQGVELPLEYDKPIPEGYEIITLEPCRMMVFQGEPYDDADFGEEIGKVMEAMEGYDPAPYGYAWADDEAPRFQLEPQGHRGYIEARPVKPLRRE